MQRRALEANYRASVCGAFTCAAVRAATPPPGQAQERTVTLRPAVGDQADPKAEPPECWPAAPPNEGVQQRQLPNLGRKTPDVQGEYHEFTYWP